MNVTENDVSLFGFADKESQTMFRDVYKRQATYDRMCLVNDAVYIAKYKDGTHAGEWTATGTQFQVPYVFKKLFSKEHRGNIQFRMMP